MKKTIKKSTGAAKSKYEYTRFELVKRLNEIQNSVDTLDAIETSPSEVNDALNEISQAISDLTVDLSALK